LHDLRKQRLFEVASLWAWGGFKDRKAGKRFTTFRLALQRKPFDAVDLRPIFCLRNWSLRK